MAKISRLISLITVCFSSKKEVVSSVKKLLMMIKIAINITKTIIKDQTSTVHLRAKYHILSFGVQHSFDKVLNTTILQHIYLTS